MARAALFGVVGTPRIGLVAPLAFVGRSGIARYQTELVRHLAGRADLHLLVQERLLRTLRAQGLPEPMSRTSLHDYYRSAFVLRNAPYISGGLIRAPWIFDWNPETFLSLAASRLFAGAAADRAGLDLIHGTMNWLPHARGAKARVLTVLDTIPLDLPDQVTRTTRRAFVRQDELRADDHLLFISKAAQADFARWRSHPSNLCRVVPLGIDHEVFHSGLPGAPRADPPYILSVGMFEPRKNLLRALAAFARLAPDHPGLRWKVAGAPGFGRDRFLRALSASPARARVDVLPPPDDAALADLYRGASCLLLPSLKEGFGFPVAEALACGTAVAASRIPAVEEAGGDAFVPLNPEDVDSISEAVEKAVFDETGRAARRERGLSHVRAFDWHTCARRHLEVYAGALDLPLDELSCTQ